MKKSKRDLVFSILSVFLIAFLMFAEISSGMAIYADTFNNNGAMPHENNGDIGNDVPGLGNDGADNGNDNLNGTGNTPADGSDNSGNSTNSNTPNDKNTGNMETWGWILAVVAVIVIIAIVIAATSKKKKTDDKKR